MHVKIASRCRVYRVTVNYNSNARDVYVNLTRNAACNCFGCARRLQRSRLFRRSSFENPGAAEPDAAALKAASTRTANRSTHYPGDAVPGTAAYHVQAATSGSPGGAIAGGVIAKRKQRSPQSLAFSDRIHSRRYFGSVVLGRRHLAELIASLTSSGYVPQEGPRQVKRVWPVSPGNYAAPRQAAPESARRYPACANAK